MRQKIVDELKKVLSQISKDNGDQTNFERIAYWQDTPTEYNYNYLIYRDTTEEYERKGNTYKATLALEIVAIVVEINDTDAAILGNLAIEELIEAISKYQLCDTSLKIVRSHKFVETKGKTACQVELEVAATYKIAGLF